MLKLIFVFSFTCASILLYGQGKQYILATSKGNKTLIAYDYQTLDSIQSLAIAADAHEIVVDEPNELAYISHPLMNNKGHEISVVDIKNWKVKEVIDTRPFYIPHGLAIHKDHLWVTTQGSKTVFQYSTSLRRPTDVWGTGQNFTHLLHVAASEDRFYTTNVESGTVSIYEKKEIPPYMPPTGVLPANAKNRVEWQQTLIDVGKGAEGFDVTPDGNELWTVRPDGYLVIVDLQKKTVTQKINTYVKGLHRLKFTPDGSTAVIVSVVTGDILFYNTHTRHIKNQFKIGRGAGIFMDATGGRIFISCTPDNKIVVMDLATRKIIKQINISRPDGIASATIY